MQSDNDKNAVETDRWRKQIMQKQLNKTMPAFEPYKYKITNVKGNMVSAERINYNANDTKKSLT